MRQFKSAAPWAHRLVMRSLFLAGTTTLLVPVAFMPAARAGHRGGRHRRKSAGLFLRLLQLCTVRLRTERLLRAGIFL